MVCWVFLDFEMSFIISEPTPKLAFIFGIVPYWSVSLIMIKKNLRDY